MAAGGENHSRVPCLAHKVRWSAQRGPFEFVGGLDCIYRCPFTRERMGDTAENLTARFGYTREAMDDWAHRSQQLAGRAMTSGFLARQIAPIDVPDGPGGTRRFEHDEFPRPTITREMLTTRLPQGWPRPGDGRQRQWRDRWHCWLPAPTPQHAWVGAPRRSWASRAAKPTSTAAASASATRRAPPASG